MGHSFASPILINRKPRSQILTLNSVPLTKTSDSLISESTPASEADLKKPNFIANTWGDCLSALFGPTGKFSDFRNHFMKDGLIWTKKCDREQLNTHGSILFEKGTPKIMDPSSFTFGGFEDLDEEEEEEEEE
ncbi:MAG: hypothetical protein EBW16_07635, partial [Burkholderiaceae bacterium]|nr:hypothetical protein [Burkholderiaceae bacterium]